MQSSSDNPTRVAMVEDNKIISQNVADFIGYVDGLEFLQVFQSVESYLHYLKAEPDFTHEILLLDIGLPGMSGLEGIPQIRRQRPDVEIIMLTTYEEEEKIVKALCSGAVGYISKKSSLKEIIEGIKIVSEGGSYMSPQIAREITQYFMRGKIPMKTKLLTERQTEIIKYLVEGKSYNQIGEQLFISVETVRTHIKKMYRSLEVNNKTEAIAMYLRGELN